MPRSLLLSLDATLHDEVISRCMRRQFLCGVEFQTGRDFTNRRDWFRAWVFELAAVFANDLRAYVVMSNHFVAGFQSSWRGGGRAVPCDENAADSKNVSAEIYWR